MLAASVPVSVANELLVSTAHGHDRPTILHAFRAWLLAVGGCSDNARRVMDDVTRGDQATALFVHSANAALTQSRG